jgi:primase-polymerase (primpol)-like protein
MTFIQRLIRFYGIQETKKRKENYMARIIPSEVTAIMNNCSVTDPVIEEFIDDAEIFITTVFKSDTTTSSVLLAKIQKWFVAHMLASTICRTTSEEKIGDASVKYTGKWDKNLGSTPYGQMVQQLDVTGKIARAAGKSVASIYAVKSFD